MAFQTSKIIVRKTIGPSSTKGRHIPVGFEILPEMEKLASLCQLFYLVVQDAPRVTLAKVWWSLVLYQLRSISIIDLISY